VSFNQPTKDARAIACAAPPILDRILGDGFAWKKACVQLLDLAA
jgi:hypothetical protein